MSPLFRYILIGLGVFLLQWLVFIRLAIWGAFPDAVLLFLVLFAFRFGRLPGMVMGFGLGFLMDVILGTWGTQMFAKTLVGFCVGFFRDRDRDLPPIKAVQAFWGTLVISMIHNGLLIIFYALQAQTSGMRLITILWLGASVYTALLAMMGMLFSSRGRIL